MLKIREFREYAQMTQKQLAEKISNMQRNISNWEQGVSEPDLQTVVMLADVFGITLDELFGRKPVEINRDTTEQKIVRAVRMLDESKRLAILNMLESFI